MSVLHFLTATSGWQCAALSSPCNTQSAHHVSGFCVCESIKHWSKTFKKKNTSILNVWRLFFLSQFFEQHITMIIIWHLGRIRSLEMIWSVWKDNHMTSKRHVFKGLSIQRKAWIGPHGYWDGVVFINGLVPFPLRVSDYILISPGNCMNYLNT